MRKVKLAKLSSNEEVIETIHSFIDALYLELSLDPKPGLITPISQNRHKDMDYFIMFETIPLIRKYLYGVMNICDEIFYYQTEETVEFSEKKISQDFLLKYFFNNLKDEIERILHFGLIVEKQMFTKTKGINTYKGIIFTYTVLFISMYIFLEIYEYRILEDSENGYNLRRYSFIKIYSYIVQKVGEILVDYKIKVNNLPKSTYGAITYEKYKYRGVIDEAKKGYPIIFKAMNYFLNLKNKANIESFIYNPEFFTEKKVILLKVFLFICSSLKDTNILGKKGEETLLEYQKLCSDAMKRKNHEKFFLSLKQINEFCLKNDISSGGTADLFSSVIALLKIFNLF
ncbi:MAG: triphosphoribosyl-dephospho-CoA synthase [Spirochaetota bacterium]